MAEQQQSDLEKTEPASTRRLEQAREQGQVARSTELTSFSALLVSGGLLLFAGAGLIDGMRTIFRNALDIDRASAYEPGLAMSRLYVALSEAIWVMAPLFAACIAIALLAPMLLSGWLFSIEALQPRWSRMSPVANLGRTFSVQGLVELLKAVLKTVFLGSIVVTMIWKQKEAIALLAIEPLESALMHVGALMTDAFIAVMLAMFVIVAIDVPFQLWNHAKQLRMTKEEVKQESKETDGNPEVKGRIRAMQREMARRRMMAEVPKADVIITNPTHYAVALRYQENRMRAPQVVAKGAHEIAERIIALGRENKVPVLRAAPLARALHKHAEIGEAVPAALYGAVAEVLAWVYQLRLARGYGSDGPQAPRQLEVPPELDPGPDPDDRLPGEDPGRAATSSNDAAGVRA